MAMAVTNIVIVSWSLIFAFFAFMMSFYWLCKECMMIKKNRSFIDRREDRMAKYRIELSIHQKMNNT